MLGILVIFSAVGVLRLGYWQVARGADLTARAMSQIQRTTDVPSVRGDILDRNGRVLATSVFRDTLGASPDIIDDVERQVIVDSLGEILGLDEEARSDLLSTTLDPRRRYATISQELTEDQSSQVRALIASKGLQQELRLMPHAVRLYPNPGGQPGTSLASQLLGFVQESTGAGLYGIEGYYDGVLAGTPKRVAMAHDGNGYLESSATVLDPGVEGKDVRLSIDVSLQLQLEKVLFLAWNANDAKRVSGIVMDPDTGEILAWASVPGYDANHITGAEDELYLDPNVSQVNEPGSVMKMLTATAALETKTVSPKTRILDSSVLKFGPDKVRNSDRTGMGRISFEDVIAYSRNVGVSKVAKRLGRSTARSSKVLYRTWQQLGIGQRTGVEVAGEVAGIAADPVRSHWAAVDLANRSFGQAVAVTLVQLATAFAPMANGGLRVQPHFLVAIDDQAQPTPEAERVMRKKTAKQVRALLRHVTGGVAHYAKGSLIPRYEVGGKTGTAQIWRQKEREYDPDTFNFTFVGYVGGDRPEAIIAVRIHETDPEIAGPGDLRLQITSYELFRRVARGVINVLDIPRSSDPVAGLPEAGSAAESAMGTAQRRRAAERAEARGSEAGRAEGRGAEARR